MKHATIYQKVKIKTWPSRYQQEAQNLTSAHACKVAKGGKRENPSPDTPGWPITQCTPTRIHLDT